jgi:pectin methylesterase-like acyl-CoA thioesterase
VSRATILVFDAGTAEITVTINFVVMRGEIMDLKVVTKPTMSTSASAAAPAAAKDNLSSFTARVREAITAAKPATVAGNSVVVQPGGKTFTTITDALKSITDASEQKEYVVNIGPGTYNEVVTCKSWVYLSGAGQGQTIITAPAQPNQASKGTVKGASNSAVQNCTVQSTGGSWGQWTTAVDCQSVTNFDIENCELIASDVSNGTNLVGLSLDYATGASGSKVNVSYSTVTANGGVQPIALAAFSGSYAHGMESKIVSESGSYGGSGGAAANYSTILVENCYVQGAAYSLDLGDTTSSITANQCQLQGAVSQGVVVNN